MVEVLLLRDLVTDERGVVQVPNLKSINPGTVRVDSGGYFVCLWKSRTSPPSLLWSSLLWSSLLPFLLLKKDKIPNRWPSLLSKCFVGEVVG